MNRLRQIATDLTSAQRINLVIHQNPDGDAIGSSVALFLALQPLGKTVTITSIHPLPSIFRKIVGQIDFSPYLDPESDLTVLLDCCEIHRTGFGRQLLKLAKHKHRIIGLDHHDNGDLHRLSTTCYCDPTASATTEIIFHLLSELRILVTPAIATALLLGVYTDTGGFQHSNTSSRVLKLASRLIYNGANLSLISQTFCRQLSPKRQRLWGKVFAETNINRFGVAIARVTADQLAKTQATYEDLNGLANTLALIEEAKAALVLVETSDGWRGTLRTRHADVDVGKLARVFGGKGQKKAAGFTLTNLFI